MKAFIKGTLSVLATTAIVTGLVYAAAPLINSIQSTIPISSGSIMGENWFQQVNNAVLDSKEWIYFSGINTLWTANTIDVPDIRFRDGTTQTTAATGGGCGIITNANKVGCYNGHVAFIPIGTMMGAGSNFPVTFCGHGGYRASAKGQEAFELKNVSGDLWLYARNFPVPGTGQAGTSWWCINWQSDSNAQALCNITSGGCASSGWPVTLNRDGIEVSGVPYRFGF